MRDGLRIAIVGAALFATAVASANGQTTFRETGSVTVGSSLVWVRGTKAGVVQLFVGRGFHDAFARAHEVDASMLARWIDSVRALAPARDSAADDEQLHGSALSADVTMMRRVGGPFSGLRLLMSGEDPITMPEPTARDFLGVLDSAVRAARELSAPAQVTTVAAVAAPAPPPPAPAPPPAPTPPAPPAPAPPAPARVPSAPVAIGQSTALPAPELVLPAPTAPVMLLASRVEILPLPTVVPAPLPRPAALPGSSPSMAPAPVPDAPTPPATVAPAVVAAAPMPTPAPDPVVAPHVDVPADKLIHTPLGPFTIPGKLLADRDTEAQYCYTQLGLKYSPDLKGEITVKLSMNADGTVQDAVVAKRNWQGISAGEVEACVRALAHDWTFAGDSTIVDGAKLVTFSFSPAP